MSKINLYVWRPDGHGEYSFIVAEESKEKAVAAVEKYIKDHLNKNDGHCLGNYEVTGWGTDYYELEIFSVGEVVTHDNS